MTGSRRLPALRVPASRVPAVFVLLFLAAVSHANNCPNGTTNASCPNNVNAQRAQQQQQQQQAMQRQQDAQRQQQAAATQRQQETMRQQQQAQQVQAQQRQQESQRQQQAAATQRQQDMQRQQQAASQQRQPSNTSQRRAADMPASQPPSGVSRSQDTRYGQTSAGAARQPQYQRQPPVANGQPPHQSPSATQRNDYRPAAVQTQHLAEPRAPQASAHTPETFRAHDSPPHVATAADVRTTGHPATVQDAAERSPASRAGASADTSLAAHFANRQVRPVATHAALTDTGRELQGQRTQLSPTTAMVTRPDHSGFTVTKNESPHSSLVVQQHLTTGGTRQTEVYRQTSSADHRVVTRTFADGRRTVDTPTFHGNRAADGTEFVQYRSGLHSAFLSSGRPVYAEHYTHLRMADDRGAVRMMPVVQRTVYASGAGVVLAQPRVLFYSIVAVAGYETFVYRPTAFIPSFFTFFYSPFGSPLVAGPGCAICPAGAVGFSASAQPYANPMDLLGDMQIADAANDRYATPTAAYAGNEVPEGYGQDPVGEQPPEPGQSAAQPVAPAELQAPQNVDGSAAPLPDMQAEAQRLQSQAAQTGVEPPAGETATAPSTPTIHTVALVTSAPAAATDTMTVPEDIRDQMRKQVRLSVAQHQHNHVLSLSDVVQSGYARIFLFQVASTLDTVSAIAGDHCQLGNGDLLSFADQTKSVDSPTVRMKVVLARPGRCLAQDTVEVSVTDLQDMLNTFNERLEVNMRKVSYCSEKNNCTRT